ncbi:MAG: YtoQ family protein [Phycisphaerales bacterium]
MHSDNHHSRTGRWSVYLAGEIHSDWRERVAEGVRTHALPVDLTGPVTDHALSDDAGAMILGAEKDPFWHDRKGAGLNAIRTRTLLGRADIVVVRFAGEYREWNAAFDAGQAVAMGTPLIVVHDDTLRHALKEVDASAMAVAQTPEQVVEILRYVTEGALKR